MKQTRKEFSGLFQTQRIKKTKVAKTQQMIPQRQRKNLTVKTKMMLRKKFRNITFSQLLKMEQQQKFIPSHLVTQKKQSFIWKEISHIWYLTASARRKNSILWKQRKL